MTNFIVKNILYNFSCSVETSKNLLNIFFEQFFLFSRNVIINAIMIIESINEYFLVN